MTKDKVELQPGDIPYFAAVLLVAVLLIVSACMYGCPKYYSWLRVQRARSEVDAVRVLGPALNTPAGQAYLEFKRAENGH